ncbi:RecX family transcriptional regulator [Facilibium subflavum]|uniref:RecX family transcriptional regulator n=1 Tax=Facilibium subflavum TaxID=2219058 RepID=UPI000E64D7E1|nr:RecX family transcriptional regulator [Facilibium subflavum]
MTLDNANVTYDMLLENKAKRIIESNQDISTGALIDKLKKKAIPQSMIDKLVIVDEAQQLNNVLRRISAKYPLIKGKTDYDKKQKLLKYLLNKGFEYQLTQKGIDAYFSEGQ